MNGKLPAGVTFTTTEGGRVIGLRMLSAENDPTLPFMVTAHEAGPAFGPGRTIYLLTLLAARTGLENSLKELSPSDIGKFLGTVHDILLPKDFVLDQVLVLFFKVKG